LKKVQNLIQITYDAGTTGEVLSPVRGDSEEIVVGAHDALVVAPVDAPVNAPVDAPVDAPVNAPAMDAPVHGPVDAHAMDAAANVLDRVGLTREEVSRLPPDLRVLHASLINAPEGRVGVKFQIPPEMFFHDGREVLLPFKEFQDFLQATSSEDKWLDEGVITVWLMLVTKN